jgi:hypothetical protein
MVAVYALARHRGAAAVVLDGQVFDLAGVAARNTQTRAVAALGKRRVVGLERHPPARPVAHIVQAAKWRGEL